MAVTRWNPWSDLLAMQDRMDRLFSQAVDDGANRSNVRDEALLTLPVDIRQTEREFIIQADVPGVGPDDVDVSFQDNTLIIRTTRTEEQRDDYVRRERRLISSFRQIALPPEVRADDIRATFEHGVVTVSVPRAEKAQPKRIRVQAGSTPNGERRMLEAAPATDGNGAQRGEPQTAASRAE